MSVFGAKWLEPCVGFPLVQRLSADIFMGDTGSLALGAALGCIAMITKTEVYSGLSSAACSMAEALSVMMQVLYYKKTQSVCSLWLPLHHHFEKKGWSETKVVIRFWIVSGVLAATGIRSVVHSAYGHGAMGL